MERDDNQKAFISKVTAEYLADINSLDEATAAANHLPCDFIVKLPVEQR